MPDDESPLIEKPITEYEFERNMDKRAEKYAREQESKSRFVCPVCKRHSDKEVLTKTDLAGDYSLQKPREDGKKIRKNPFGCKVLVTCEACHHMLTTMEGK